MHLPDRGARQPVQRQHCENAYVDELTNFFGVLNGTQKPRYSFEKDLATIQLIERIERF